MTGSRITTTEEVYEDGNRATTIYRDGQPVVIVTMGDGEEPEDYWEQFSAAIDQLNREADETDDGPPLAILGDADQWISAARADPDPDEESVKQG